MVDDIRCRCRTGFRLSTHISLLILRFARQITSCQWQQQPGHQGNDDKSQQKPGVMYMGQFNSCDKEKHRKQDFLHFRSNKPS